jgi:hypothetical protein
VYLSSLDGGESRLVLASETPGVFRLFRTRLASGAGQVFGRPHYAVAPDGRFLMNTVVEDTAASPITVIVNWAAILEGR